MKRKKGKLDWQKNKNITTRRFFKRLRNATEPSKNSLRQRNRKSNAND
jgi:hypothetical protein